MTPTLVRGLVLTFSPDGVQLRVLEGLATADVVDLGTSGYEIREDVIGLSVASPSATRQVKEGSHRP